MLEISDACYTITNTMTRLSGAEQMPIVRLFRFKHMHATQTNMFTLQVYVGMRDHEAFIQYLEEIRMDTWAMVRGSNDEPTPRRFRTVFREGTLNSCQCVIRDIEYDERLTGEGHFPRLASINVELLDHCDAPKEVPVPNFNSRMLVGRDRPMALFRISNFVTRISGSDQIFRLNIDVYYSASAGWRVIFNDMYFVEEQVDSFRQFQNEIGQCSAMYIIQEAVQGYEPYKFIPVDVYVPCVLDVFEVVKSERNGYDVHQVRIEITVPPQIK